MPKTTLLRKQVTPTGTIQPHAGALAPDGYLACDGTIVTIADYPTLYATIGTSWGYGNNDGLTFHLPDLRGRMLRGQDQGAGRDPDAAGRTAANAGGNTGDTVGSVQSDAARSLNNISFSGAFNGSGSSGYADQRSASGIVNAVATTVNQGWASAGRAGWARGWNFSYNGDPDSGNPQAVENRPINANVNYVIKAI
jgi:microcystin-dependent protein